MDIDIKIGEQLAHLRKSKGFTQEQLASILDLHEDYISKIERGLRSPSVKTLLLILDKLEVKYSYFFASLESN
ncbi:helix-turn-helix transcriptional regulator [Marivirga salinae]|uniref:Helix-turn-helix transcriptional regulator n=1 Tax=Marivirga salinarum TaxID=3059078 RepID=A0AA49GCX3_9BACT|nr:helix-turn-helix transcriptional regulator [Marivirga sp. BDSF4-3]WKK77073.1 helix-turn-helix transcriptional regulator [Marivirga sp. BDSF4-3]